MYWGSFTAWLLAWLAQFSAAQNCPATPASASKYCVIGAGPAGVQMGHLMHRAGLDYVLFEQGYKAGMFFNKYPIHRRLNSYNRRNTRTAHPDFRLRHDWHTLLEHDDLPRFTNWTLDFHPLADTYVDYLNTFQQEQVDAGRVRYCHTVTAIRPGGGGDDTCAAASRYEIDVRVGSPCEEGAAWDGIRQFEAGEAQTTHGCSVLVMADGMWKPNDVEADDQPWMIGTKFTVGYDELHTVPLEDFEDKRVLLLGFGNAALETVDAVRPYAADIVVMGRGHTNFRPDPPAAVKRA
jgi:cation diffusion facilitator CzcD-associated flavoprotein CzcO